MAGARRSILYRPSTDVELALCHAKESRSGQSGVSKSYTLRSSTYLEIFLPSQTAMTPCRMSRLNRLVEFEVEL